MTGLQASLAVGAGAVLSLERKSLAQLMLSRPIVVAPLLAWLLGDAHAGLWVGVPLELFFLGTASYGASTPEHETLAALFAAAVGASAGGGHLPGLGAFAVAVLLSLPFASLGRRVEAALEHWNEGLVDRAQDLLLEGRLARASRQALVPMLATALLGAAVVALGLLLGPAVGALEDHLGAPVAHGLEYAWLAFVGIAAALGLRSIQTPGGRTLSAIAAATVFAVFALSVLAVR